MALRSLADLIRNLSGTAIALQMDMKEEELASNGLGGRLLDPAKDLGAPPSRFGVFCPGPSKSSFRSAGRWGYAGLATISFSSIETAR